MLMAGYRIKTVGKLLGIPRNTLLAWERRYAFVVPQRSPNGYRLYSEADVALLRAVKAQVDDGFAVSEAIELLKLRHEPHEAEGPAVGLAESGQELFDALMVFDRDRADVILARLSACSYANLIDGVFFPLLQRIGEGWISKTVTIPQEHFASHYIRDQLVGMLLRLGCGPAEGPRVVCACFPEDQHELGLLGLSVRLALNGWRVTHLGARMPQESLVAFLEEHPSQMVCIGVTFAVSSDDVDSYARSIRAAMPSGSALAMGGPGLPDDLPEVDGVRFHNRIGELA